MSGAIQEVRHREDFEDWRNKARKLLSLERAPSTVAFVSESDTQAPLEGLFSSPDIMELAEPVKPGKRAHVPAAFLATVRLASAHRDGDRWGLFYRLLWRITHGEPELLSISIDPDVARLASMHRSVRRDMHKMTAFVRFREIQARDPEASDNAPPESWFVAWYEPDHRIVRLTSRFFVERFNGMRFSILTPDESLHWDGKDAVFGPSCSRADAPRGDKIETLWKTYYASIFNPARIKEGAMKKEMAVRYWKNLPEAALIPGLIRAAPARLQEFYRNQAPGVEHWLPPEETRTWDSLRAAAMSCRACGICEKATQTVFGEGPATASLLFVGEQPGDQEDLAGKPFIGPAGQLLNRALAQAGIERDSVYLTNAVKHFKWTPGGTNQKARIHQRPSASEIAACKPWLTAELALLQPKVLVCLGVSAAQSVLGKSVVLREVRGEWHRTGACERTWVTIHPSAILREQSPIQQEREFEQFVSDLSTAHQALS